MFHFDENVSFKLLSYIAETTRQGNSTSMLCHVHQLVYTYYGHYHHNCLFWQHVVANHDNIKNKHGRESTTCDNLPVLIHSACAYTRVKRN